VKRLKIDKCQKKLVRPETFLSYRKAPLAAFRWHFRSMSRLSLFLRVGWVSLAGCGTGEQEVAFAGVAGKGGGAFELNAGFGVAA